MPRPKRYSLAIELTSQCNQHCTYCYNDWREDGGKAVRALETAEFMALVDRALTEVELDHVTVTGGEPFLRKDIFALLDVVHRHGVGIQVISNGGLIADDIAERLVPYDLGFVQVALNGHTAELHEAHVGKGHYERTLRGLDALLRHRVRVSGCVVVSRKNAAFVGAILDQFRERGVMGIALSRFSPAGYAAKAVAELLPSRSDMVLALEQAEERAKDHGMRVQVTMPVPICVLDHKDYPHVRFGTCPIGTEMQELALGPRGELRNCTLHTEVVGDARATSLAALVDAPAVVQYRDTTPEFCAPCPHHRTCQGGCRAAAAGVFGTIAELDPFVAQHVNDDFRARLRRERGLGSEARRESTPVERPAR